MANQPCVLSLRGKVLGLPTGGVIKALNSYRNVAWVFPTHNDAFDFQRHALTNGVDAWWQSERPNIGVAFPEKDEERMRQLIGKGRWKGPTGRLVYGS